MHGAGEDKLETSLGVLATLGLHAGMAELDRRTEPYLRWLELATDLEPTHPSADFPIAPSCASARSRSTFPGAACIGRPPTPRRLEGYRRAGCDELPRAFLSEKLGYWPWSHLGLEPARRSRGAIELESTFWALSIRERAGLL